MTAHDIDIELPEHDCLYETTNENGFIDVEPAYRKGTVLRLIEADRKRMGEPVGYFYPWELERSLKAYPNGFPGAVAVFAAPQPAESSRGEPVNKGPWKAGVNRIDKRTFIQSDDFTHDVRLYVDGDFADQDEKLAYALGIADQLNAAPQHLSVSDIPAEPVSRTDWNSELSSWSDEDFIRIFHERPDLANRLRKILAEPVKYLSAEQLAEILTAYITPEIIEEALEKLENAPWELSAPVKMPSDAEIGQILKEVLHNSPYGVHQWELWLEFASALFTRYGQTAHQGGQQ